MMNWMRFEKYLNDKINNDNIAGVAVGVSKKGETTYSKGFGVRDVSTKEPVTPDTVFGVASITKSFTALAILMLEEEGKLSTSDPVVKYLPDFSLKGVEDMEEIKILHLLSHTTGIAPLKRDENINKLSEHLDYFKSQPNEIIGKPGETFRYCNDTFLLLGLIIQKLTGKLYRRHITDILLNKLNMYRTTMSLEEVHKMENVSTPYDLPEERKLVLEDWPMLGNYEVGGGIRSTINDLLKYGELFINKGTINGEEIVSKDAIEKMWIDPFKVKDNDYYGYALKISYNYHGVTLIGHGGGHPGVSSMFTYIPEEDIFITILCNVWGVRVDHVMNKMVNTLLDLPFDTSW